MLLDHFHDKPAQTEKSEDLLDMFFDLQSGGEDSSSHKEGKFNQRRRTQTIKEKGSPFRVTKTL